MKTVKVKFSTQINNTRKLIAPIVVDRLRGNEVDEDGDFVAPLTTSIALLQGGMVLLLSDLLTKGVDKDTAITNLVELTMATLDKSIKTCLNVEESHKEKREMAEMEEGIAGDPNNVADMIANLRKRTKHWGK
tara:strand:+ start:343 stop:741 length:399 start_codon:yes stop_codon:yes gene_type:complete